MDVTSVIVMVGGIIGFILWQILKEMTNKNEDDYNEKVSQMNENKRLWEEFGGNRQAMIAADKREDEERW